MADVDKLTDAELRVKLMEYGLPPLPVTGTTRKVMIKKLKLMMGNKSNSSVDGRRSLGRYSSGEDSDSEDKNKRSKRRVTISAAPMQPPPAKPPQPKPKPEPVIVNKPETRNVPSRRYSTAKTYRDEFDTGSDSEQEIELMRRTNDYEPTTRQRFSSRSTLNVAKTTSPESPKAGGDNSYTRTFSSASSKPSAVSSPVTPAPITADAIAGRINQIKWRLSNSASGYSSLPTSSSSHEPPPAPLEKAETPFLSQFTKRLSQLSASKRNANAEHDTNGGNAYPSSYPTVRSYLANSRENYHRGGTDSKNLLQGNFVPFAVLGVAVLFFIFVGFIYLGMRSDTSLEASGKAPMVEDNPYSL